MKKILTGAIALSMLGTAAMAGGYSEPDMEEEVVVQQASTSSAGMEGWVVPVLLLALVAVAVSGSDSDSGYTPPSAE